jgi:FkbM family methyltransferase
MAIIDKSELDGGWSRAQRFMHKPWDEKLRAVLSKWASLTSRCSRTASGIRMPVRLPFGAWWIPRNDNLAEPLLAGVFETAELNFVEHFLRRGMTVLDLGAHQGLYTLLASLRVGPSGKVISFEPSRRERRSLRLHLTLNRRSNVMVQGLALGEENGEADLYVVNGTARGCNSLRPPDVHGGTTTVRVQVVRLDDWLADHQIDHVDFVKMDIEGAELGALKGAARLLERRPRPVILAEVQDARTLPWGYRAKEVVDYLIDKDYRWFNLLADGSLECLDLSQSEFDGNFVAFPREREMESGKSKSDWTKPYEALREKWVEVPTTRDGRNKTTRFLEMPDDALLAEWEKARADITTGPEFAHRGWYHTLYADGMRGKKVLDVGSGFGVDSITFAQHGASLTFVDLVETNLNVLKRLCGIMNLKDVKFQVLEDVSSLRPLDTDYDVIMAMGSLHHAPTNVLKPEFQELIRHLKVGGRWLQLAYPESRWARDGKPPFSKWGEMTDGVGTPWAEPYDVPKLLSMFAPAKFEVVLYQEFHNSDFNWFDLLYKGM